MEINLNKFKEQVRKDAKQRKKLKEDGILTDAIKVVDLFAVSQLSPELYNQWAKIYKSLK